MLNYLGLSRSNYYQAKKRPVSQSEMKKQVLKLQIKKLWQASKQIYGAPKITHELRKHGFCVAVKTVGNYMREMGLHARYIKPWTVTTRNSDHDEQLSNVLNEQFNPVRPNAAWCIDTTYIPTREGFAYLTSVMDLYSRRILAWDLSDNLEVANVIPLIERAKDVRNINQPLIIHSDRGSQFTSKYYRQVTSDLVRSYSKKAFPWDNACIESFHALIKREWLNHFDIASIKEVHRLVFEYIDTFYNTIRIHSHCGYMSPNDFEAKYYQSITPSAA